MMRPRYRISKVSAARRGSLRPNVATLNVAVVDILSDATSKVPPLNRPAYSRE